MKYVYLVFVLLPALAGLGSFIQAKERPGALMEALMLWLIAAVFCVAAEIVESRQMVLKSMGTLK